MGTRPRRGIGCRQYLGSLREDLSSLSDPMAMGAAERVPGDKGCRIDGLRSTNSKGIPTGWGKLRTLKPLFSENSGRTIAPCLISLANPQQDHPLHSPIAWQRWGEHIEEEIRCQLPRRRHQINPNRFDTVRCLPGEPLIQWGGTSAPLLACLACRRDDVDSIRFHHRVQLDFPCPWSIRNLDFVEEGPPAREIEFHPTANGGKLVR